MISRERRLYMAYRRMAAIAKSKGYFGCYYQHDKAQSIRWLHAGINSK